MTSVCSGRTPEGGIVRLEQWPEGYVLWYHGEIVWKSWVQIPVGSLQEHIDRRQLLDADGAAAISRLERSVDRIERYVHRLEHPLPRLWRRLKKAFTG